MDGVAIIETSSHCVVIDEIDDNKEAISSEQDRSRSKRLEDRRYNASWELDRPWLELKDNMCYCKLCHVYLTRFKKHNIEQHERAAKHKINVTRKNAQKKMRSDPLDTFDSNYEDEEEESESQDLCESKAMTAVLNDKKKKSIIPKRVFAQRKIVIESDDNKSNNKSNNNNKPNGTGLHVFQPKVTSFIALDWSETLERLDPIQKIHAKKAINDILYEAELGNLNKNSVQINMPILSLPPTTLNSGDQLIFVNGKNVTCT